VVSVARSHEAIRLRESPPAGGVVSPPRARLDALGEAERHDGQAGEEALGGLALGGPGDDASPSPIGAITARLAIARVPR
jgi:hypothetical protein